ncbi:hypothetical protein [Rhizobium sp. ZX09]|uniref:hypothetical protein n=1 Tax=Rhizobium sp. ZX09 TaxID=2291939 RepID=UPI001A986337|nr:hypothetical protein [Rhizobium sp. ZX09]QSZ60544.1 hypothetical protein BTN45_25195 [Rhizobium sp. ZX09]
MSVPSVAAEAVPARAGLSFGADDQNRQGTGGFTGSIRLTQQGKFAGQQVSTCADRGPALAQRGWIGRPAARKRP